MNKYEVKFTDNFSSMIIEADHFIFKENVVIFEKENGFDSTTVAVFVLTNIYGFWEVDV